jgi:hypothetical protein
VLLQLHGQKVLFFLERDATGRSSVAEVSPRPAPRGQGAHAGLSGHFRPRLLDCDGRWVGRSSGDPILASRPLAKFSLPPLFGGDGGEGALARDERL